MLKRTFTETMITLVLTSMLMLVVDIQPVKASGTLYIRADGSVDPPTPYIQRDDSIYSFTDNIHDSIVVEKDNIVVDGAGYTIYGTEAWYSTGIRLWSIFNVTVKNTNIKNFDYGIYLNNTNKITIIGNNITKNNYGVLVKYSSNNSITGNNITAHNYYGISLPHSSNNIVSGNSIANNRDGIQLGYSSNNIVSGNSITANNMYGIWLGYQNKSNSGNNSIYHNNFIDNAQQVSIQYYSIEPSDSTNYWDNGYPSGGNYWSDYDGIDLDKDGIGDDLHFIDEENRDRYPIMSRLDIDFPVHNLGSGLGYSTIQQAIDAAETENGHIIAVDEGTYYEHVVLNKTVTLVGENRDNTIIDGGGNKYSILVLANDISVCDLTVTNATAGIRIIANNSLVNQVRVYGTYIGIWASESAYAVISESMIFNQTVHHGEWEDFGGAGIALDQCIFFDIIENYVSNNEFIGIWVRAVFVLVDNNLVSNNTLGLELDGAANCIVTKNYIVDNWYGVGVSPAANCSIYANNIVKNLYCAIELKASNDILIYHNNFINNSNQIESYVSTNTWDNGCQGNYWSNYNRTNFDEYGIGYDPYVIDENNTDHYPLMNPYISGDVNHDAKVNIVDISIIAKAFGSSPEDATWDPHADMDENGKINILDLATVAVDFGNTIYN